MKLADHVDYHLREEGSSKGSDTNYVHIAKQMEPNSLDFCWHWA